MAKLAEMMYRDVNRAGKRVRVLSCRQPRHLRRCRDHGAELRAVQRHPYLRHCGGPGIRIPVYPRLDLGNPTEATVAAAARDAGTPPCPLRHRPPC